MPRSYRRKWALNPLPTLAFIAAVCVFCVSGYFLVNAINGYLRANSEYDEYRDLARQESRNNTPEPQALNPEPTAFANRLLDNLLKENQETVAWLEVGNTKIQYPVVLTRDNDYYTTHTFAGKENDSGAIFADCRTSSTLADFNTVIYGHNRRDGSMFAQLLRYSSASFFTSNQTISLTTFSGKRKYSIFSTYQVPRKDFYTVNRLSEAGKMAFIDDISELSTVKSKYKPTPEGSMLTLITCVNGTDDYWIVHARRTA